MEDAKIRTRTTEQREGENMSTSYRHWPRFEYVKPEQLGEVLNLLSRNANGSVRIYAGGTDIIRKMKLRLIPSPELLIDLKGMKDMDYIARDDSGGLRIGPLATIAEVAHSEDVRHSFPGLAMAAGSIASVQIQNRGTIAGNICNAVPSADSAPALLCLGAELLCASIDGERRLGIEDFFAGPSETVLKAGELLREIQVPPMPEGSRGAYLKLSTRSRMDLAVVGVAVNLGTEKGVLKDVKIGLGAVAPTPIRARAAEEMLDGEKVSDHLIDEAAKRAGAESKPISDHRGSAEYRRMMVEVLVKRAIRRLLA